MSNADGWNHLQGHSEQILAEGIFALRSRPSSSPPFGAPDRPGNYLILLGDEPLYVGEAKGLAARLRSQFRPKSSTFFKNYLRTAPSAPREIHEFRARHMETTLGRKEVEDFGIANIPTPLNRFQLGKREQIRPATESPRWLGVQSRAGELIRGGEAAFLALRRGPMYEVRVPRGPGLYGVWSDTREEPVYLGESSDIGARHKTHCGTTYFSALRRHVGTEICGFTLQVIKGRKRYFSDEEDLTVTRFLRSCRFSFMPVALGRIELEEHLIARYRPLLNRKGNFGGKG